MKRLNPEKLFVNVKPGFTTVGPLIPRRYTLTHSDETGELYLEIGPEFAHEKMTEVRDEVLAEWSVVNCSFFLYVYIYVGYGTVEKLKTRYDIFQRELPLALQAIVQGDRQFLESHPWLYESPIWIKFDSKISIFNRVEYWGKPLNYVAVL